MTRRERPSLEALGHAGLKRSMSHAETPGAKPGQRFFMEVDEAPTDLEEKTRVQNIITPSEAQMLDASTWTSTMITYAIRGILSSDRASQLRRVFSIPFVIFVEPPTSLDYGGQTGWDSWTMLRAVLAMICRDFSS